MMTTTEKNKQVQSLANEGTLLINKAESLLQKVVTRNITLAQEVQQAKAELAEKVTREQA